MRVTIEPGQVYYYDGVTVHGTQQLRPSYLVNRFKQYHGKPYSPETLDQKFRELTRTGLFNIVRINPDAGRRQPAPARYQCRGSEAAGVRLVDRLRHL